MMNLVVIMFASKMMIYFVHSGWKTMSWGLKSSWHRSKVMLVWGNLLFPILLTPLLLGSLPGGGGCRGLWWWCTRYNRLPLNGRGASLKATAVNNCTRLIIGVNWSNFKPSLLTLLGILCSRTWKIFCWTGFPVCTLCRFKSPASTCFAHCFPPQFNHCYCHVFCVWVETQIVLQPCGFHLLGLSPHEFLLSH